MKYFHTVRIKGVPASGNRHQHWRLTEIERKRWHRLVAACFQFKPKNPLTMCNVYCTRASSRKMDYDNLVYSFKAVFDGLVHAKIIEDDDMETVLERKYTIVKVPKKEAYIEITVEEV